MVLAMMIRALGNGHNLILAVVAGDGVRFSQATHEPGVMGFTYQGFTSFQANLQYVRDTQVGFLLQPLQLGVEVEVNTKADGGMGGFVAPPGWWS